MEKQKLRKIITIGTIFTSIVTMISLGFKYALLLYMRFKLSIGSSEATAIGIIGGADGPTVIYLAGNNGINIPIIALGLLSIAGIIYLILNREAVK